MSRFVLLAAALGVCLLFAAAPAGAQSGPGGQSGVSVSPMMVVLDTRGRPAGFDVVNFGDRVAAFRLDPLHATIGPEGVQRLGPPEPGPHSAIDFLRWAPRQFEVHPGGVRTVRLSARPPAGLPPGEYRLHLRVTNIGPSPQQVELRDERALGTRINVQVAQAVRVLVRHGVGPGTARLDEVGFRPGGRELQVSFSLVNNHDAGSVLGRYALLREGADGTQVRLRETDVTLYPETPLRRIELSVAAAELLPGARYCLHFWSERDDTRGPGQQVCSGPL